MAQPSGTIPGRLRPLYEYDFIPES